MRRRKDVVPTFRPLEELTVPAMAPVRVEDGGDRIFHPERLMYRLAVDLQEIYNSIITFLLAPLRFLLNVLEG